MWILKQLILKTLYKNYNETDFQDWKYYFIIEAAV